MRAIHYDGKMIVENAYPVSQNGLGEALLRVRMAGICNTDLELMKGYMDFSGVLGHEFVAEVVQGAPEWLGKRVVGEINIAEGECEMCLQGIPSQCYHRTTMGIRGHQGAFADYMSLDVKNLYAVADNISDEEAVFVEPLAAACQVLEAVHIQPRDKVVVIGAGKLGLLCAQVLRLTGADVSVIVRRERPYQFLQKWGIRGVSRQDVPSKSAHVVVDCTGTSEGFAEAVDIVKPRGHLVLKSTYEGLPSADLTRVVVDEIKVIGSRCGPFDAALRLLEAGLVDVASLIEASYAIEDAKRAFAHAQQNGTLKIMLTF